MDRQYLYRRLIPMTYDEYLDEPGDVVEWTLRMAAERGDAPWQKETGRGTSRPA